tara:strand:+ start:982 stop:1554 length:573 start_codon:yes stop_codon:yes gene_type:complete
MKESYSFVKKIPFYKKKQFFTILIGLFFIMLMALSAVNIGMQNEEEGIEYEGLEFFQTSEGWEAYSVEDSITLVSNPETLNLSLDYVNLGVFEYLEKVYISTNLEDDIGYAMYDLERNLDFIKIVYACYEDSELCEDMPLKDCDDAVDGVGVIIFKEGEEDKVTQDGTCLNIEGKDLLKVTDNLILDYYV